MTESLEKEELKDDSTESQAHGWSQDALKEKEERGRRGRDVQRSTCHSRILAGRTGALHDSTHPP